MQKSKRKRAAAVAALEDQIQKTTILWWRLPLISETDFDRKGWDHLLVGLSGLELQTVRDQNHSSADNRRCYAEARVVHDIIAHNFPNVDSPLCAIRKILQAPPIGSIRIAFAAGVAGEPESFMASMHIDPKEHAEVYALGQTIRKVAAHSQIKISVSI